MTHRTLALVAASLLVTAGAVGPVAAQSDPVRPAWSGEVFDTLQTGFALYNDNSDSLDLGPLAGQLENKRVNLYVRDGDETAVYSFRMTGAGKVVDLREASHPDASLRMETERATIERVATADNPARALADAIANDEVTIRGERGHVVAQVTWTVLNVLKGFLL